MYEDEMKCLQSLTSTLGQNNVTNQAKYKNKVLWHDCSLSQSYINTENSHKHIFIFDFFFSFEREKKFMFLKQCSIEKCFEHKVE